MAKESACMVIGSEKRRGLWSTAQTGLRSGRSQYHLFFTTTSKFSQCQLSQSLCWDHIHNANVQEECEGVT